MMYIESFRELNKAFASMNEKAEFDGIEIRKFTFHSQHYDLLPGNENYFCQSHNTPFKDTSTFYNEIGTFEDSIHIQDYSVDENRSFNYYIMKPVSEPQIKKVIFLFHGFNEKNWNKYLTWAKAISENTRAAIILFPIAFHMERAKANWSEKREMFQLSEKRKQRFPNIIHSTLSNVAISMRLHAMPQRFIWSGLQTFYDVIQFVEECRQGLHPMIPKDFTFDIFAYSIGGLLAEILKLSDYKGYFTESKVGMFCGGAVFNRLSPVSKFILDSEANVALYSYLVEHFDSYLKKDARLHHYIVEGHIEGKVFHAMLDYKIMRDFREGLFKKMEKQFYAVSLKKDYVVPSYEIINTLQGAFREINIRVDEMDFQYPYNHENPFPSLQSEAQLVNDTFKEVFDKISDFYLK